MKKKSKLYLELDNFIWRSDRFHRSIQNKRKDLMRKSKVILPEWIDIHFKTYPRLEQIKITPSSKHSELEELLQKRKSIKKFTMKPIEKNKIDHLLYFSFGKIDDPSKDINLSRRPYPSGGARYPLEVYIAVLRGENIPAGLYHYNVRYNTLEVLVRNITVKDIAKLIGNEKWILDASMIVFITAVFDRSRIKYGDRGYMYTLLEAGHAAQNVFLLATKLGLNMCPLGGFADSEVAKFLDIEYLNEYPIYTLAVGE